MIGLFEVAEDSVEREDAQRAVQVVGGVRRR